MIPSNSIWIVETSQQFDALERLEPRLRYRKLVLQEECDIHTLPEYELVFFLLSSAQVGNKFFLQAIEEVLRVRKSGKTIFLAIDGNDRLNDSERAKLAVEVRKTVRHLLTNPPIYFVSSYYAALSYQYSLGEITLDDLRLNKKVLIPVEPDGWVTGKQINENHAALLWQASRLDKLLSLKRKISLDLEKLEFDVAKKNWFVVGPPGAGTSLITALLQSAMGKTKSCAFTENVPVDVDVNRYYDGLVIVLDLNVERSVKFLEDICAKYTAMDKVVVINKIDQFMYLHRSKQELQADIAKAIGQITRDKPHFVSSYYYEQYKQYNAGHLTLQDLIDDPEIVLEDELRLPVAKAKNQSVLPGLLEAQSGYATLLRQWE